MAADGRAQPVPRSDGNEDADDGPAGAGRREPRGRGTDGSRQEPGCRMTLIVMSFESF